MKADTKNKLYREKFYSINPWFYKQNQRCLKIAFPVHFLNTKIQYYKW